MSDKINQIFVFGFHGTLARGELEKGIPSLTPNPVVSALFRNKVEDDRTIVSVVANVHPSYHTSVRMWLLKTFNIGSSPTPLYLFTQNTTLDFPRSVCSNISQVISTYPSCLRVHCLDSDQDTLELYRSVLQTSSVSLWRLQKVTRSGIHIFDSSYVDRL